MNEATLTIAQWIYFGAPGQATALSGDTRRSMRASDSLPRSAPVHAVALSGDGRHIFVGFEYGFRVVDRWGNHRFARTLSSEGMAYSLVVVADAGNWGVAVQRSGNLHRFDVDYQAGEPEINFYEQAILDEPNDVYALSLTAGQHRIAVGHYGPALTMIDANGQLQWRRHPYDRNPTDGQTWAVAFNAHADGLYVGCSSAANPLLALLDAQSGAVRQGIRLEQRVIALAALPPPLSVVAILNDSEGSQIVGYADDLHSPVWTFASSSWERLTALAVDLQAGLVVVGSSTGALYVLDSNTGALQASNDTLHSTVLSVAIAMGRYIAAGLQEDSVAYLEYIPPQEDILL